MYEEKRTIVQLQKELGTQNAKFIAEAWKNLNVIKQRVIFGYYNLGKTLAEIAEEQGCSIESVRYHRNSALRKMRARIRRMERYPHEGEYEVEITETLRRTVKVRAGSRTEAEQIAEDLWSSEQVVLTAEDFDEATFKAKNC